MSLTIFSPPLELVRWSREAFLRVLRGVKHEGLAGWVETWAAFTMHGTACQVVQRGLLRVLRGVEREGGRELVPKNDGIPEHLVLYQAA